MIPTAVRAYRGTSACLLLALLVGCSEPDVPLTIPFAAYYGSEPIDCDRPAGPIQLTDLRLYVSAAYLLSDSGEPMQLDLLPDGQWQQGDLALLDLENGNDRCENGTRITRAELQASVRPGDYRGLAFEVGVPFDRNHGDPLQAEPPLGDSAMHWSWRGGYKFLRAGIRTETDGFWVHLGSTGCEGTIQDISHCSAPNRVTVTLPDFEPGKHQVVIDLAELFGAIDLHDAEPGDCSSGPAEIQCEGVFDALGLDFRTGDTGGVQRVFRSGTLN